MGKAARCQEVVIPLTAKLLRFSQKNVVLMSKYISLLHTCSRMFNVSCELSICILQTTFIYLVGHVNQTDLPAWLAVIVWTRLPRQRSNNTVTNAQ